MDKPRKYPVPGGGTCSSLGERGLTIKFRAIKVVKYISQGFGQIEIHLNVFCCLGFNVYICTCYVGNYLFFLSFIYDTLPLGWVFGDLSNLA